jgi:hypothetical protein
LLISWLLSDTQNMASTLLRQYPTMSTSSFDFFFSRRVADKVTKKRVSIIIVYTYLLFMLLYIWLFTVLFACYRYMYDKFVIILDTSSSPSAYDMQMYQVCLPMYAHRGADGERVGEWAVEIACS